MIREVLAGLVSVGIGVGLIVTPAWAAVELCDSTPNGFVILETILLIPGLVFMAVGVNKIDGTDFSDWFIRSRCK